jgi:hypothetical protein
LQWLDGNGNPIVVVDLQPEVLVRIDGVIWAYGPSGKLSAPSGTTYSTAYAATDCSGPVYAAVVTELPGFAFKLNVTTAAGQQMPQDTYVANDLAVPTPLKARYDLVGGTWQCTTNGFSPGIMPFAVPVTSLTKLVPPSVTPPLHVAP